jgi:hypothetical protein
MRHGADLLRVAHGDGITNGLQAPWKFIEECLNSLHHQPAVTDLIGE